jgi:hypothetical protein
VSGGQSAGRKARQLWVAIIKRNFIMEDRTDTGRAPRVDYPRPPEVDRVDPSLTLEECVDRRAIISETLSEISAAVDNIKGQLESAEVAQLATGVSANPEWSRRANGALRYHTRAYQDHQRALGNLNRRAIQLGQSGGKQAGRKAFIRHAREILPPELYSSIWAKVDAELSGKERAA